MLSASRPTLTLVMLVGPVIAACAQDKPPQWTDWGGGYSRGPDSASTTVATSGGGANKPAPVTAPLAPVAAPTVDWGGGYIRGSDSASTTAATSGAGPDKPK